MEMMRRILLAGLCSMLTLTALRAEGRLEAEARAGLARACRYFSSISTYGGYCGIYSIDLKERYGEAVYEPAKPTEIWVQPPGTPSVGEAFLRAYRVTNEPVYLKAAEAAGLALAWGERAGGGWAHRVDLGHFEPDADSVKRNAGSSSFDDEVTQGALSFLIKLDVELDTPWLTEAIDLALAFMMESQFANGAWSQWYPLIGGYHDYFTFHDGAINDCIRVMLEAHRAYGRSKYLETARRGGDFIVLSQLPAPQAGWAQQYSHDLEPAWARKFEPAGVCSAVTAANILTLIDLYRYTGDSKYLRPILPAIEWLERSRLKEGGWARLYEVDSNRPIYGDRNDGGKVHYDYAAISAEERSSYAWQGGYGISTAMRRFQELQESGPDPINQPQADPATAESRAAAAERLVPEVERVLKALDSQGRWIRNQRITSADFVTNTNLLCRYLDLAGRGKRGTP